MNNNETLNQAAAIQSLKPTDVIRNDYVRSQFISVDHAIWKEGGEGAYEREAMYFNNQLRDNDKLRKCTGMSVFWRRSTNCIFRVPPRTLCSVIRMMSGIRINYRLRLNSSKVTRIFMPATAESLMKTGP